MGRMPITSFDKQKYLDDMRKLSTEDFWKCNHLAFMFKEAQNLVDFIGIESHNQRVVVGMIVRNQLIAEGVCLDTLLQDYKD